MSPVLEKAALVTFGIVISLILGEVAARALYHFDTANVGEISDLAEVSNQDDAKEVLEEITGAVTMARLVRPSQFEDVVYELRPNIHGTFQGKPFQFNSFGIRDAEYALAKPKDTYRIAGIGDSVMFGWGVKEDQSYLSVIEERLNSGAAPGKKVEVLNFGVPGYNTAMEAATFEHKVLQFEPDLLIIHFVKNDFQVPLFMELHKSVFDFGESFLWELIQPWLNSKTDNSDSLVGIDMAGLGKVERRNVVSKYQYMLGESGVRTAMRRISDLASPRGIPVILLTGGGSPRIKNLLKKKIADRYGFYLVEVKPYVDGYARAHLNPDTPSERRKLLAVSPKDPHPNALGHKLYADALMDMLEKIGIYSSQKK